MPGYDPMDGGRGYCPPSYINGYGSTRAGAMQRAGVDPVQVRIVQHPEDDSAGMYPRAVIRPAMSRFLLNRMGGNTLDTVAPADHTPYMHVSYAENRNWERVPAAITPQVHRLGFTQPRPPGPQDIALMQQYSGTIGSIRSRLSDILASLNG